MMNRLTARRASLRVNNGVRLQVCWTGSDSAAMPGRNQKDNHHG